MKILAGYNHTTLKNDLIAMRIPKLVPPHLIVPLCFQEVHPKLGEKCWISGGFLSSVRNISNNLIELFLLTKDYEVNLSA